MKTLAKLDKIRIQHLLNQSKLQNGWNGPKIETRSRSGFQNMVGMTGFEPATPSSRTKYATGLRYIPKQITGL